MDTGVIANNGNLRVIRHQTLYFFGILSILLSACGGDKTIDEVEDQPVNIDETVVTIEAIDSMWVSGPENVITDWNEQILIPSATGLLTINLDENGFVDRNHLFVETSSLLFEVQSNILAAHDVNKVIFYNYDGIELNELSRTDEQSMQQVPFTSENGCFYWVATSSETSFSNSIWEACNVADELNSSIKIIASTDTFIMNIVALPDNRLVTVGKGDENTMLSLYEKQGESYQLLSTVNESKNWTVLDMEYRDNFIYIDSGPSDTPNGLEAEGLVRYRLEGNTLANKTIVSSIIADNAQYDHIALSPHGIILGNDKKILHFKINSQGEVEKIVSAEVENSVASIFVQGDYIITVLRDPPSSFDSNQTGLSGVHIYSLNSMM
jgi:hypothetical protein